jgi:peptidoglycan hydrolase-like protein with peptidoglycan-binding domain
MAEPLLKRGSSGSAVRQLQEALKEAGHDPGAIDGEFGPATEAAVSAFQQEKGIAVDGIVGDITWLNIDEDARLQPSGHPAQLDRPRGPPRPEAADARRLRHGRRRRDLRARDRGGRQGAAARPRARRGRHRRAEDVGRDRRAGGLTP